MTISLKMCRSSVSGELERGDHGVEGGVLGAAVSDVEREILGYISRQERSFQDGKSEI